MNDLNRVVTSAFDSSQHAINQRQMGWRGGQRVSSRSRQERRKTGASLALFRAFVAVVLIAAPTFESRFGRIALPLLCVGLAAACIVVAVGLRSSSRRAAWMMPIVDAATLLIVVPTAVVASEIIVADARLGGGTGYFAAASAAVVGATGIVALVAASSTGQSLGSSTLALLPAPLVVAAIIAGADRFSAGSLAQGLAIAWLVAALVTLLDALTREQARSLLPPAAFAMFVVLVTIVGGANTSSQITATKSALALISTAIAGATLLLLPTVSANADNTSSEH